MQIIHPTVSDFHNGIPVRHIAGEEILAAFGIFGGHDIGKRGRLVHDRNHGTVACAREGRSAIPVDDRRKGFLLFSPFLTARLRVDFQYDIPVIPINGLQIRIYPPGQPDHHIHGIFLGILSECARCEEHDSNQQRQ
ncbi:hypothetical protein [Rhizobium sp. WYJ-E13]|uniref:hypothetical protein n=1 Tax=Rhizobium sp. WYJ-E13 TaxID=2849093 RepID=UPI001C1EDB46|nr:hypothetical protein [Rhizobium sp. WYJ-E13]QWW66196.1 hypothetical protein KQ933_11135 [Rhizobium sp. WYJ-E13]